MGKASQARIVQGPSANGVTRAQLWWGCSEENTDVHDPRVPEAEVVGSARGTGMGPLLSLALLKLLIVSMSLGWGSEASLTFPRTG